MIEGQDIGDEVHVMLSTAIGLWKHRIPSDLRSQSECRPVSTMVGDHTGILGAVVFVNYNIFVVQRSTQYNYITAKYNVR